MTARRSSKAGQASADNGLTGELSRRAGLPSVRLGLLRGCCVQGSMLLAQLHAGRHALLGAGHVRRAGQGMVWTLAPTLASTDQPIVCDSGGLGSLGLGRFRVLGDGKGNEGVMLALRCYVD